MVKIKASEERHIDTILKHRPTLNMISDVAWITDSTDQIWFYWMQRIGAGPIIDYCRAIIKTNGGHLVAFDEIHPRLLNHKVA